MSKRLFQVLDEMNVNDEKNKTATCGCCFDLVSADKVKAGGVVKMGVPAEAITKIFLGDYKPMLVLLDMKEYERLRAQPVEEGEQKAARFEKALKKIVNQSYAVGYTGAKWGDSEYDSISAVTGYNEALDNVKSIANEALTPKQTTDDTANG